MEKKVYTVSQMNRYIKGVFARDYALNHLYVKGEVSNCKYHTSGHIYFTLKDASGQMPCVMFAGNRGGLSFQLSLGQNVVVFGSIGVYERDGRYQLYAEEIILDGIGALYQRYDELKQRLLEEGLFSELYKKPVPAYCGTIGIVTAPTGAAIQDMVNISHRRNPFAQLVLCPALVQGEGAVASIVKGIRLMDQMGCDVLVVGRGGGSLEDLWAFNEEEVVRAVFECVTPVISAVGHETDTTLCDFAADLRAPTPSAAAELANVDIRALMYTWEEYKLRLSRLMQDKISRCREQFEYLGTRLSYLSPQYQIAEKKQRLIDIEQELLSLMMERLKTKRHSLELMAERLYAKMPLERLRGGYAYVTAAGRPLSSVEQVSPGDMLRIVLADGSIMASVKEQSLFTEVLQGTTSEYHQQHNAIEEGTVYGKGDKNAGTEHGAITRSAGETGR